MIQGLHPDYSLLPNHDDIAGKLSDAVYEHIMRRAIGKLKTSLSHYPSIVGAVVITSRFGGYAYKVKEIPPLFLSRTFFVLNVFQTFKTLFKQIMFLLVSVFEENCPILTVGSFLYA